MKSSKYANSFFKAHIAGLLLTLPLTIWLTFTYMFKELAGYKAVSLVMFLLIYIATMVSIGLAFKKIKQNPLFALTGLAMGLIPLILYMVLPDKSNNHQ